MYLRKKKLSRNIGNRSGGFTLVIVLAVVAMAATLGYALLSGASLRTQAARNAMLASEAESVAESGMNLASYYLQYPARAPITSGSYWTGGNAIGFGGSTSGTADVTVAVAGSSGATIYYDVTSTGRATSGTTSLSRKITSRIEVNLGTQVKYGATIAANTTIPASVTITGDIQSKGTVLNLGKIIGTVYCSLLTNAFGVIPAALSGSYASAGPIALPSASNLKDYRTYTLSGITYSAVNLNMTLVADGTTLGATASNPAGIYYVDGNLEIRNNVTITGTLVCRNGTLTINGSGSTVTPATNGFPGLVVKSNLILKGGGARDFRVAGVTWLGGTITSSGIVTAANHLDFVGSVMFAGSGTVSTLFGGKVNITYDNTKVSVPDIDTSVPSPNVRVLSWKQ